MELHKIRLFVAWMLLSLMAGKGYAMILFRFNAVCFWKASSKCEREATVKTQVNGTLDSKSLMPCQFDSSLLSQATQGNTAVVWTFKKNNTTTSQYLVEIGFSKPPTFWNARQGRIIPFAGLSKEGNFSILLNRTRLEDQGIYLCELYDGVNCSLGVQEIQFTITGLPLEAADASPGMMWSVFTMINCILLSAFCCSF